jgi:protein-tyrosine phosphatase
MIRVLFVCLGNICRSPMAEAVFRHKVREAGLADRIEADSAGTGSWHIGKPPHQGTIDVLTRRRIDYSGIIARQVSKNDLDKFDYIVAMDENNVKNLRSLGGDSDNGKIARLLDFVPEQPIRDVPDPYYTGNFDEVYELVDQGCEKLLDHIREREGL